jgi:hypothetical protein
MVVQKALLPDSTLLVLREFWGLEATIAVAGLACLIFLEAIIAFCLLFKPRESTAIVAAIIFLVLVTSSPLLQFAYGSDIGCGCGGVSLFTSAEAEQLGAVARNLLMIFVIATSGKVSPLASHSPS